MDIISKERHQMAFLNAPKNLKLAEKMSSMTSHCLAVSKPILS
jgi:hypothetical protein